MPRLSTLLNTARYLLPYGAVRLWDRWQAERQARNFDPQTWQGQPFPCRPEELHFTGEGKLSGCVVSAGNETRVALVARPGQTYRVSRCNDAAAYLHLSLAARGNRQSPRDVEVYVNGRRAASLGGPLERGRWTTVRIDHFEAGRPLDVRLEFRGADGIYLANPIIGSGERSGRRNLIVVIADSLRPVNVGCLQQPLDGCSMTPNIDRFFAAGRAWENAYTQGEWTLPSVASMALGVYAVQHGVYVPHAFQRKLPGSIPTLAELLQSAGYRTYCSSMGRRFLPTYGHYRGFDRFLFSEFHEPDADAAMIGKSVEFMEAHKQEPFFSFLHFFAAHPPYGAFSYLSDVTAQPHRWGVPVDLYARVKKGRDQQALALLQELAPAKIRQFDHNLQLLFSYLESSGLLESTTVVLLSDHGRMYTKDCLPLLRPELAHVPLLIRGEGVERGLDRSFVEPGVDLAPTLLELAGLPVPEHYSGRSLLQTVEEPRECSLSESLYGDEYEAVIRSDQWCYVFRAPMDPRSGDIDTTGGGQWLFARDPRTGTEATDHDQLGEHPDVARQMRQHVLDHLNHRQRYFGPDDRIAA